MAEPTDHTIRVLREIQAAIKGLDAKVDRNHDELRDQMTSIRQAVHGESVLGRYAAAEVEERLTAVETRLDALEKHR